MRKFKGFVVAVLTTYVLATIFVSQGNLAAIAAFGLPIDLATRFQAAWHDMTNMVTLFLPLSLIALLIAFLVCAWLTKRFPAASATLYPLAGFTAIMTLIFTLNTVFGLTPIAPTRTMTGLLLQGLAGAAGGFIYYKMVARSTS
ncbi:MAG: hypothetical protein AB8B48_19730 [Pseudomonadales bacterium]